MLAAANVVCRCAACSSHQRCIRWEESSHEAATITGGQQLHALCAAARPHSQPSRCGASAAHQGGICTAHPGFLPLPPSLRHPGAQLRRPPMHALHGGLPCMHYTDAQGCTGGLCPSACARGPVIADHLASSRPPGTSAALRAASARTPPAAFPHRRPPPLHPSPSRYGAALHERSHVGRWRCARPHPGASEPRALPFGAPEG